MIWTKKFISSSLYSHFLSHCHALFCTLFRDCTIFSFFFLLLAEGTEQNRVDSTSPGQFGRWHNTTLYIRCTNYTTSTVQLSCRMHQKCWRKLREKISDVQLVCLAVKPSAHTIQCNTYTHTHTLIPFGGHNAMTIDRKLRNLNTKKF